MDEINIWWEGPFSQNDIIEKKIKKDKYSNTADRIGLYQIYGTHPLYGNDVLLYIGKTKNKNGFSGRLKNRWVISNGADSENVTIYLGTIYSPKRKITKEDEKTQIDKAEALLINALKPAFNSSNIQSVKPEYCISNYLVNNINNYRNLFPLLSSEYFLQEELNLQLTEKLSKLFNAKLYNEDEYYGFTIENDNIFIGVDYDCLDKTNTPLHIGIQKSLNKEIHKQMSKDIIYSDEEYSYFSATEILDNKDIEKKSQELKVIIEDIQDRLKNIK